MHTFFSRRPARKWLRAVFLMTGVVLFCGCSNDDEDAVAQALAAAEAARNEVETARAEVARLETELAVATAEPDVPDTLRVWRDNDADELSKWLRLNASCYRFEGDWVFWWLEIEIDGEMKEIGCDSPLHHVRTEPDSLHGPVIAPPTGAFFWVRGMEDDGEAWGLGFRFAQDVEDGEISGSSHPRIRPPHGPPQPASSVKQELEFGPTEAVLEGGKEVTLLTLKDFDENDEVTRIVRMKCRVLKDTDEAF